MEVQPRRYTLHCSTNVAKIALASSALYCAQYRAVYCTVYSALYSVLYSTHSPSLLIEGANTINSEHTKLPGIIGPKYCFYSFLIGDVFARPFFLPPEATTYEIFPFLLFLSTSTL